MCLQLFEYTSYFLNNNNNKHFFEVKFQAKNTKTEIKMNYNTFLMCVISFFILFNCELNGIESKKVELLSLESSQLNVHWASFTRKHNRTYKNNTHEQHRYNSLKHPFSHFLFLIIRTSRL